jgi:hypothetical protein
MVSTQCIRQLRYKIERFDLEVRIICVYEIIFLETQANICFISLELNFHKN